MVRVSVHLRMCCSLCLHTTKLSVPMHNDHKTSHSSTCHGLMPMSISIYFQVLSQRTNKGIFPELALYPNPRPLSYKVGVVHPESLPHLLSFSHFLYLHDPINSLPSCVYPVWSLRCPCEPPIELRIRAITLIIHLDIPPLLPDKLP